jgi:hypothetical protein
MICKKYKQFENRFVEISKCPDLDKLLALAQDMKQNGYLMRPISDKLCNKFSVMRIIYNALVTELNRRQSVYHRRWTTGAAIAAAIAALASAVCAVVTVMSK